MTMNQTLNVSRLDSLLTASTRKTAYNSTFAKWRVEKVLVRSVFNLTFVASRQIEVPNPPIRKSSNRYVPPFDDNNQ
jgi:hypothetical protein